MLSTCFSFPFCLFAACFVACYLFFNCFFNDPGQPPMNLDPLPYAIIDYAIIVIVIINIVFHFIPKCPTPATRRTRGPGRNNSQNPKNVAWRMIKIQKKIKAQDIPDNICSCLIVVIARLFLNAFSSIYKFFHRISVFFCAFSSWVPLAISVSILVIHLLLDND